jgi:hypothetical protein
LHEEVFVMSRLLRTSGLFLLLGGFMLPAFAADTSKTDKKGTKDSKDADAYVQVATYEGTVKKAEGGSRSFTVELVNRQLDPQDVAARAQRLAQLQAQLVQQTATANKNNGFNRQAIFQTQQQIAQEQAKPPKFIEQKMDKDFDAPEEVKVRVSDLPVEFDNNGKPKRYTKQELADKKGPGNLWGYPGQFESMAVGQQVRIIMGVKKSVYETAKKKRKTPPPKKGGKPMEEDLTEDLSEAPVVRQIHIMLDPTKK